MFQTPAAPIGEPKPETPRIPAPPVRPAPAPPESGSFTQMFQTPAAPIGELKPEPPRIPAPLVRPAPAQPESGEFTRFFKAAPLSPAAPPCIPHKPEAQGEFAKVFGSGDRVTTPTSTVTGIFKQSHTAAPKQELSGSLAAPTTPQAYAPPAGEFTKIFGDTSMKIPAYDPVVQTPAPGVSPPPVGGPGEYTRMFSALSLPKEPAAAPTPAPIRNPETPVPTKQNSKLVPALIGVILLLLAAIAVIVVAMKK